MILGCATRVFGRQVVLVANVRPSLLHPICLRVIVVRKAVWLSGALIVPVLSHGLSIIVIAGRTFTTTLWKPLDQGKKMETCKICSKPRRAAPKGVKSHVQGARRKKEGVMAGE